jgi:hypothetical protein
MLFNLKTLTGRKIYLESDDFEKIIDIKKKLNELEGIEFHQIRLIMIGKMLNDTMLVKEVITNSNQSMFMVLSLRGG